MESRRLRAWVPAFAGMTVMLAEALESIAEGTQSSARALRPQSLLRRLRPIGQIRRRVRHIGRVIEPAGPFVLRDGARIRRRIRALHLERVLEVLQRLARAFAVG